LNAEIPFSVFGGMNFDVPSSHNCKLTVDIGLTKNAEVIKVKGWKLQGW